MSGFLSSTTNYLIFKRHIERKALQLEAEMKPFEKQMLKFQPISAEISEKDAEVPTFNYRNNSRESLFYPALEDPHLSVCSRHLLVDSDGNSRISYSENKDVQKHEDMMAPIDASQFSLFNASPPMDLDPVDLDVDEDQSKQQTDFCQWFLHQCQGKGEEAVDLSVLGIEDVFVDLVDVRVIIRGPHATVEVAVNDAWILVRLLCTSPSLTLITLASKPLAKVILDRCEATLSLNNLDLNRVTSFLCDRPILDLQLAHSILDPGQQIKCLNDMRVHYRPETETSDGRMGNDDNVLELVNNVRLKLQEVGGCFLYESVVCPTNVILATLERNGLHLDIDLWKDMKSQLEVAIRLLETQARDSEKSLLSLNSPLHLREVIYTKLRLQDHISDDTQRSLGIDHLVRSRSTNEVVLWRLSPFHPLPHLIIKYRRVSKTKAIYIDSFSSMMDHDHHVIRGVWDQTSSLTGRIYCCRPNLQALPRPLETDSMPGIKSIFVAPANYTFLSADFCQIELRLFAHVAQDRILVELFAEADRRREDVFDHLSRLLDINDSGDNPVGKRDMTKKVVYGSMYGIGTRLLAETLSMSVTEARSLLRRVNKTMPAIGMFTAKCHQDLSNKGYLETVCGRRRSFKMGDKSDSGKTEVGRQIVNYVIQGSAADISKMTMVSCQRMIGYRCIDAQLMLTRHDELVWLVHLDNLVGIIDIIHKHMNVTSVPAQGHQVTLALPMTIKLKKGVSLNDMNQFDY